MGLVPHFQVHLHCNCQRVSIEQKMFKLRIVDGPAEVLQEWRGSPGDCTGSVGSASGLPGLPRRVWRVEGSGKVGT